ncbi:MAG: GGDEF domain-containing protein [Deltaproteobacteria bacterium]|nr:GGDEF domain-containing protein [Deltaproteobacteria bacterium]
MMFLFCIRFTVLDLQISTDYSSYTIGIFVLAFLLRISEWKFIIFTLLGFIFYIINLFIINTNKLSAEVILPIIIISVLANFLVFSKERTRKKIFILKKDLEESAIKDPLTQLYNRRYMMEYLIKQVACYKRLKTDVSLLLIDIDFFKKVNDTLGHSVGDSVLTELSQILQKATRDTDLVTRYGGEEFIIILSNTNNDTAFMVAERIRENVEQFSFNKVPWNITVSIGISGLHNEDSISTLIDSADKNLYIAKEEGRNRIIST